jgi:hypothetical protein
MAAHAAVERHEQQSHASRLGPLGRRAALVVSVLAVVLAVAEMLGESTVKTAITSETKVAAVMGRIDTDEIKVALHHLAGNPAAQETSLRGEVAALERERDHADAKHSQYEIATVLLQVAIVVAGLSVLTMTGWLLGLGAMGGLIGALLLLFTILGV